LQKKSALSAVLHYVFFHNVRPPEEFEIIDESQEVEHSAGKTR